MAGEKYKSYNRIHNYSNPSDVEKGKIKKETESFKKLNKKSKNLSDKIIKNYTNLDDSTIDMYENYIHEAEQEKRNSRGHKKRLKELKKRRNFY